MGLLDTMDDPQFRLGMGLLAAGSARSDGAGVGQRLNEVLGSMDQWKQQQAAQKRAALQEQMLNMQMQEAQQKQAQEKQMRELAAKFQLPGQAALPPLMGDPSIGILPSEGKPAVAPSFDYKGYAGALAGIDPIKALELRSSLTPKPIAVKEGESLIDPTTFKPVFSSPKEKAIPADLQMYEYAVKQGYPGSLQQFITEQKRAGATNISNKIDAKMGEGIAAQVGPMLKESYTAANGAAQQVDAAGRIIKAVDSGKIIAGPFAGTRMTIAQLGQLVGVSGKNDAETIARSRDVIRGLAEMTLQGRKQMTGQGAITESEGLLAEKANSGRVEDLTPAEIRQLAQSSARAAKWIYEQHGQNLNNLSSDPSTAGLAKFYKPLPMPAFNFESAAPAADIDNLVKKYAR